MIRNNICLNSHPAGCLRVVKNQSEYAVNTLAGGQAPAPASAAPAGTAKRVRVRG
ncbi:MAG: bifunctional NADH-specific enoyl-ACP reductase/trans-2-enoyl-CoA reductase, partial [Spirochaetaceae bacterium]|nr:bifunctional NADH-specific enoyl-ACP reductase/trans-2-enoyl-CoA reductase [Spirochaetaceae bacterium]